MPPSASSFFPASWWRLTRRRSPSRLDRAHDLIDPAIPHDRVADQGVSIARHPWPPYLGESVGARPVVAIASSSFSTSWVSYPHGSRRIPWRRRRLQGFLDPLHARVGGPVDVHLSREDGVAGLKELDERLAGESGAQDDEGLSDLRRPEGPQDVLEKTSAPPMGTSSRVPGPGSRPALARHTAAVWRRGPPRRRGKEGHERFLGGGDRLVDPTEFVGPQVLMIESTSSTPMFNV